MYNKLIWRLFLLGSIALLCTSPARADYEAGQTAWETGRHAEALAQWQAAAKTGDARAMLALGRAYVKGLGVPQDYVEAHKWLNLAAAEGYAQAASERDALAAKMTAEERSEAQKLARAWRSGSTVDAPKAVAVPQATAPSPPAGPPPPRAIREAQELMAALGYDSGRADGRWGPRTGRAYTAFLRDAGLPLAEVLTPDALRAMRTAAKGRNVAATAASPRPAPATQRQAAPPADGLRLLAAAGDVKGVKAALTKGANANAQDGKGWTALMYAADKGHALMVPALLRAGADPNLRLADGATALFIAVVHGHLEIAAALLRAGADASIVGPRDQTPLDMARSLNHSRILVLPEVVAFEEAQARREREAVERKKREEERQRAEAESAAFEQAKASDTPRAWAVFLSSWCPGGELCPGADSRLDESVRASLTGKSFSGHDSLGESLSIQFSSPDQVTVVHDSNKYSGNWEVVGGKVRVRFEYGGFLSCSAVADLVDNHLEGREDCAVNSLFYKGQKSFTWRLAERSGEWSQQSIKTDGTPENDYSHQGGD